MKYSVGYRLADASFLDEVIACREHISEVYFAWGDFASGRGSTLRAEGLTSWEAQAAQCADLQRLSDAGIALNLLLNATCYGRDSQSRAFFEKIGDAVDYIRSHYGLASVTTTSPLIARFIHENFEGIDVRASVNVGIGSIDALEYARDVYDSFYLKRELNRDFNAIREIRRWCDDHGKTLYALANSGCLNHCPAHTFHDNLVSHESEIAAMDNGYAFEGLCRQYLAREESRRQVLAYTNFIRPEDVQLYEGLFPALKLATRTNPHPSRILRAYIRDGRASGSALSLLEPDHTAMLYPYLLENSRIRAEVRDGRLVYANIDEALIKLEEVMYVNQ